MLTSKMLAGPSLLAQCVVIRYFFEGYSHVTVVTGAPLQTSVTAGHSISMEFKL